MKESNEVAKNSLAISAGRVLVVDDEEKNRALLRDCLEAANYEVEEAIDGDDALRKTLSWGPDAVLLDVMMPKINGFDVCGMIKKDPQLSIIPIIIMTALSERKERLLGIKAGANDFLVKPLDYTDALLRIGNAVREKRLHDRLRESYQTLKELECLRDNLTHMIVHDMRSPLMVIRGYLDLLARDKSSHLSDKGTQYIGNSRLGVQQLANMVDNILDISRLENGEMPLNKELILITSLIEQTLQNLRPLMNEKSCDYIVDPEALELYGDGVLISRILENLLGNALKYTPEKEKILIEVKKKGNEILVEMTDKGPGVPEEFRERIFDKFGQVEKTEKRNSSGLGLAFCKLAVESHGGKISVRENPQGGSIFWFTLPHSS